MTGAEWQTATSPFLMCAVPAVGESARKKRLFAVACCRRLARWFHDPQLVAAVEAAEGYADGAVPLAELERWSTVALEAQGTAPKPATGFSLAWQASYAVNLATHYDEHVNPSRQSMIVTRATQQAEGTDAQGWLCDLLRDIYGHPFRPVRFNPEWRTDTVTAIAREMYEAREFSAMPILADALQDAGCDADDVLSHCRDATQVHVRGCWVVDSVLGKT